MNFKRRRGNRSPFGQPGVPRRGKSPSVPWRRVSAKRVKLSLARGARGEPPVPPPAPPPAAPPPAAATPEPTPAQPTPPLRRAATPEFTAYGSPTPVRSRWRRLPAPIADPALRGPRPSRDRLWPALVLLVLLAAAASAAYHWRDRLLPPSAPATASAPPSDAVAAPGSDLPEIRRLLRQLDFAPGYDGAALDDATRGAIRQFQHMAGLPETGEPSRALLNELRQVAAPLKQ